MSVGGDKYYFFKLDHGTSVCRSTMGFRQSVIDPFHNARIHFVVDAVDTSFPESLYIEFREAPLCSEICTSAQFPVK